MAQRGGGLLSYTTRILVTGGSGILATELRKFFPLAGYYGKEDCDVTNPHEVRAAFQETRPEIVIHCAALTAHNAEPYAYVVGNIQGTCNVVGQAKRCGARFIYPSTDYLGARQEAAPVCPVNAYAASKYAGELVTASIPHSLVVRGSWYSRLELSHAATDAFTTKLPVDRAAYYIAALSTSSLTGVINIGGQRRSYYEVALEFNERVIPVSRHQIKCGYEIPFDCSLNTEKLTRWLTA